MESTGFDDLLQQARQMTADMQGSNEPLRVERNLFQIREAALKMAHKAATISNTDNTDLKASLLLGSRGFDVNKASHKLESLNATKSFEPLEPLRETDIQSFLKNERENALLAAVEQTRKATFEEIKNLHWISMENEWAKEKEKILNSHIDTTDDSNFIQDTFYLDETNLPQGKSFMDATEMAYARQVLFYNESVIGGGNRKNLINQFTDITIKMDDQNSLEVWSIVQTMIDLPMITQYDSLSTVRSSTLFQTSIVKLALVHLEKTYVKFLENMVSSNLLQAKIGGLPMTYNLVRGYFNVRPPISTSLNYDEGRIDGYPVWALIYCCLRCGDLEAVMQVANKARQTVGDFFNILQEYKNSSDKRLSVDAERELRLTYRRSIRTSVDPYKKAVYCIVGRCDPHDDQSDVALTLDDYLWVKLSQLSLDNTGESIVGVTGSNPNPDRLTLFQLQTLLIDEYGEAHFNALQKPFVYFRVLFLTGQFESAIAFLSRIDNLRCLAVHVAIVLNEFHLLLTSVSSHQVLLITKDENDQPPLRRLNFARLISLYIKKFETSDPKEALNYYYFLRDIKMNNDEDNLFLAGISDLVLNSKEFDLLLGQLQMDGTRRPGIIDKFQIDVSKIIRKVANDMERLGQLENATILNDLAMEHNKVIELLNKLLKDVLSQPSSGHASRERIKNLALSIAERYSKLNLNTNIMIDILSTFHLLLDITSFFDLYHSQKFNEAYNIIQDLDFLPFSKNMVEQKIKLFANFTDEVRRSLPDILLATVNIIYTLYKELWSADSHNMTNLDDNAKVKLANNYKSQVHALVSFSGALPYKMPGDTTTRLVYLESQMK